ncbi:GNAT family N-acetyltransferase [Paenibacillus daejeonensis]|uniref:GNAT family N-acetyltransferase n=1 Tax=Paenibacillus daejeonensis TaxID=135193 RepID=UPI00035D85E3|nr:GNAT family N-acetyltransferase [Paenibacillus daejeonensis]
MEQALRQGSKLRMVETIEEASAVSAFLLGPDCFDDQRFTPGEEEQLKLLPLQSIGQSHMNCWYEEDNGTVISAIIFVENEHRSGGYRLDYFGVHRSHRHQKLGWKMIDTMIRYCTGSGGRYIETFTCDLAPYQSARQLFERNGFTFICHLPDYYYPGEGKLVYMKML